MPTGITTRYRGLAMGPDNALYAVADDGFIFKITATMTVNCGAVSSRASGVTR